MFGEEPKAEGSWAGRRSLQLDGTPAFELSYWCGTCQFLFRRLEGANATVSLADLESALNDGLDHIGDDVVTGFGDLLGRGIYIPLLVEITPRLQLPGRDGDYFAEEQIQTWGLESFWGLPEYPRTPYYRTFETAVGADAHLYEFVAPMVPPSWNDAATVSRHAEALARSSRPTAVAVSTLDICAPAVEHGQDYYDHWGLTHFLLDGHHKMQAAAQTGRPLRLLSLLSVESSLASSDDVAQIATLRSQAASHRSDGTGRRR